MPIRKQKEFIEAVQEAAEQPLKQDHLLSLVGYNCRRAYLTIVPLFDERMAQYNLKPAEFSVLSLLKANPNITQKRLSAAVNVSPPNLAIMLDKLEQRGLVLRQRNPLDKRSQTLILTEAGTELCMQSERTTGELEAEATAMLTDQERAQLLGLLQKIFVRE
ncbi:MarR family transcriptional regulator [Duganella sp. FT92W]|uniref:MarR family transcriptional regulator n=1 Tax=Pseudoduganella rivuli TaxID=2666085 RepID=A0A7X2IQG8_9BURK|nr:MarR family transcriptional regulator [Pseudoduganella rivuli]MRV73688.1 MarR family transcriptional regulator [Pseudoduganella rivuli]